MKKPYAQVAFSDVFDWTDDLYTGAFLIILPVPYVLSLHAPVSRFPHIYNNTGGRHIQIPTVLR